ncbi:DNA-binding transcriptional regulator, LysR family [Sporobacter termitidis DSM 10068]|uniref:DNA-binding transcriptional regulator, LysR family n=1 Tax=Sporobacter termitidis DSM 10068 TaxID=1123282 RepID=A0A1M5YYL9_9FIRM|nr:LysR family transcriptional regulator [Sporobacter termitidis]SHI17040.1 DNA-binding transcriptional regulator, LysR family [Sporobacter termitidis DSM 10068]
MDTLQLKLFISVSQTLNFTRTATEFFMTQPTVSNYIKSLENSIGVRLLNRDSHSVSLTPEGQEFVGYASQLLMIQTEAENRLRNISEGRRGYIRIAMLSSAAELFSACLDEFSRAQPNVQVDVDIKEGTEMMRDISQCAYDIYFANRYMMPENDSIDYIVTGTHHLHLFVHRDIADSIDINDWSTLAGHKFVSVPETDFALSGQLKNICMSRGVVPDIINYYNRADTLFLAVNSNIGLTILPPGLTYFYNFPNVVSMPIGGDDAVINSVVAWHKSKTNPDAHKFLQLRALARVRQPS